MDIVVIIPKTVARISHVTPGFDWAMNEYLQV